MVILPGFEILVWKITGFVVLDKNGLWKWQKLDQDAFLKLENTHTDDK